jgi:hypothetical protein
MLNELLAAVGYKQKWHICWIAMLPGKLPSYGDGTFIFTPRLTADRIRELRTKLADETGKAARCDVTPEQINITGLARIGG